MPNLSEKSTDYVEETLQLSLIICNQPITLQGQRHEPTTDRTWKWQAVLLRLQAYHVILNLNKQAQLKGAERVSLLYSFSLLTGERLVRSSYHHFDLNQLKHVGLQTRPVDAPLLQPHPDDGSGADVKRLEKSMMISARTTVCWCRCLSIKWQGQIACRVCPRFFGGGRGLGRGRCTSRGLSSHQWTYKLVEASGRVSCQAVWVAGVRLLGGV